jgi:hypothetical protein
LLFGTEEATLAKGRAVPRFDYSLNRSSDTRGSLSSWKSVGDVFRIGLILDAIYQFLDLVRAGLSARNVANWSAHVSAAKNALNENSGRAGSTGPERPTRSSINPSARQTAAIIGHATVIKSIADIGNVSILKSRRNVPLGNA